MGGKNSRTKKTEAVGKKAQSSAPKSLPESKAVKTVEKVTEKVGQGLQDNETVETRGTQISRKVEKASAQTTDVAVELKTSLATTNIKVPPGHTDFTWIGQEAAPVGHTEFSWSASAIVSH
mmetsp:Transcript_15860/g.19666  ORF Transcript_15860/g.19666 Transcript_15860/m.19666 type:complete len:121 (+) Transcript_15860:237-599(+)|eukprot:CAMPEP_0204823120 /NCGR_PEP_ID=MMETSP1346-20131115/1244_1 /ASSEMBLY_ACC=CAM_ASM_000771 /TAXON_ID=215587 /ORGANISM="Aplanochytrium stocchinoi, Strain GSBS06" /LENGTH=120 /DNA_ID=CAMNT_0051949657 /DNA_START=203 /DNA_END=565 /DNA_ORIENTATION=-